MRAAHLILDYVPISRIFQVVGQAIRVGNSRLACIDVSKPGFLARKDLPPVQHAPQEVTILRKETASVQLSLKAKIDQFHLQDERVPERPVELSNSETEFDRLSIAHRPKLVVTRIDSNSEGEEESMDLK